MPVQSFLKGETVSIHFTPCEIFIQPDASEKASLNLLHAITLQSTFSLFSPIGIAIGIALTETVSREEEVQSPEVIALQGLATGTLLYVVFFELLEKERQKKGVNGLVQVSCGGISCW